MCNPILSQHDRSYLLEEVTGLFPVQYCRLCSNIKRNKYCLPVFSFLIVWIYSPQGRCPVGRHRLDGQRRVSRPYREGRRVVTTCIINSVWSCNNVSWCSTFQNISTNSPFQRGTKAVYITPTKTTRLL